MEALSDCGRSGIKSRNGRSTGKLTLTFSFWSYLQILRIDYFVDWKHDLIVTTIIFKLFISRGQNNTAFEVCSILTISDSDFEKRFWFLLPIQLHPSGNRGFMITDSVVSVESAVHKSCSPSVDIMASVAVPLLTFTWSAL